MRSSVATRLTMGSAPCAYAAAASSPAISISVSPGRTWWIAVSMAFAHAFPSGWNRDDLSRRPGDAEGGDLSREVYTAGMAAIRAQPLAIQQLRPRSLFGPVPRIDDELETESLDGLFGRNAGGLDVVGQNILTVCCDDQVGRAESRRGVDVAGRAIREPGEIGDPAQHQRVERVGRQQRSQPGELLVRIGHACVSVIGCLQSGGPRPPLKRFRPPATIAAANKCVKSCLAAGFACDTLCHCSPFDTAVRQASTVFP